MVRISGRFGGASVSFMKLPRHGATPTTVSNPRSIPEGRRGQAASITGDERGPGRCFAPALVAAGGVILAVALLATRAADSTSGPKDWKVRGAVAALKDGHPEVRRYAV